MCNGLGIPKGLCECPKNGVNKTADCNGVCGGPDKFDECGVCGGTGKIAAACGCSKGHMLYEDCFGVCGGPSGTDECGVCNGPGIQMHLGYCDCD